MKLNAAVAYVALLGLGSFGNAQLVQDACPAGALMDTDILGTRRQLSTRRRLATEAIVSNGFIKLGINDKGSLNVAGSIPSVSGERAVGLRVLLPDGEYESTSQGCTCEGWVSSKFMFLSSAASIANNMNSSSQGASFTPAGGSPRSGYANESLGNGGLDTFNLSAISPFEATSTVILVI